MSYKQQQLNVNNVTSHTHTIFDLIATEAGQQKIVDAINNINISAEIGDITVESSDTQTHTLLTTTNSSLSDVNNNLTSIDGKFDGVLTTDASNNLLIYSSNIASTPLISGFATEDTQLDIKNKTDSLSFFNNDSVLELNTFDSQVFNAVGNVTTAINNKHLDSTTDSVTVSGTVSIDTTGLALEATLQSIDGKVNNDNVLTTAIQVAIKNASLTVDTGLNISGLATETTLSSLDGKINNDGTLTDAIQVAIKNTSLDVNTGLDLSTLATQEKQDTQTEELVKVVDKKGDIEGNVFYPNAEIWADSEPQPELYPQNPNGWLYINAEIGNALNLYYFNGTNEIKTLSQVVGQYAVVSNFTTKLLNSLIFNVYTKGTPFYTSRVNHSPISGVNLTPSGKFLCYWGQVPDDIYPNLPRLNFTSTTGSSGPQNPNEEVLSVSFSTDSGATPFDVVIFIESLGVVFNNSGVNQSRVLNLLSTDTEYAIQTNIHDTLVSINTGVNINNPITNYATETGGNLASIKENTDKNTYTGNALNVNTGISNYALETDGNLQIIKEKTDNLTFANKDNGLNLQVYDETNNTKLTNIETYTNKLNDITYTGNDLNVNVGNQISGFGLETTLSSIKTNSDKLKFVGDDLKTVISNTGFNVNNQISNYATETGGNLASIKTNTDKFKFVVDDLKTVISNTEFDCSNIASTPLITNYAIETGGFIQAIKENTDKNTYTGNNLNVNLATGTLTVDSVKIKDSNGNNLLSTTNALNSYITNTSVNTHNYASSNGTDWHHLSSDANGQLNIHSKTQDGAGTDITSTLNGAKQSLDVNVSNTVSVSGTFYQSTQPVAIKDGENNPLTSTDTTATQRSLDTASCLYTTDASVRSALTSTLNGAKRSLDVNVSNTVPISGSVGISSGAKIIITDGVDDMAVNSIPSSITTTKGINTQSLLFTATQNSTLETASSTVSTNFNALDVNLTAYNRTNSDYTRLTSIQPIGSANTRALETYSYNVGLNNSSNLPLPITSTTTDTTQSMDTYINNDKTTNYQNITGINMYPNLMKFKSYPINGYANTGGFTVLTANGGDIINISNASLIFGASYLKTYSGQITGTGATNKSIMIDYVNSSGNEVIGAPFTITTTNTVLLTNIWGVNRVYLATNTGQQNLSATEQIRITYTQNSITVWAANLSQYGEECAFYTVPNGYVACCHQFQFWSQSSEALNISKFSANGTRYRVRVWTTIANVSYTSNMSDGGFTGFLSAGDTLVFSTDGTASTSKKIYAQVNAIKLS